MTKQMSAKDAEDIYNVIDQATGGKLQSSIERLVPLANTFREKIREALEVFLDKAEAKKSIPVPLVASAATAALMELVIALYFSSVKNVNKESFMLSISMQYDEMAKESKDLLEPKIIL